MKKNGKKLWFIGTGTVIALIIAAIGIAASKKNIKNEEGKNTEKQENQSLEERNSQAQQENTDMQNTGNERSVVEEAEEETPVIAMYIPYGNGEHIFAGEQTGIFTATFPDEIYDMYGNKITKEQLVKGNIVKIYGNGMMLESYPGQYPGITRMEVTEEGKPSDADVYQDVINEIYQKPDPSEPPFLNVEYTDSLAVVTVMVGRGGYEWTYTDENGLINTQTADSVHVLDWKEIADIVIDKPVDLTFCFSLEPQETEVVRYDSSLSGKAQENPQGEKLTLEKKDGKLILSGVSAGYIYDVTGIWENGRVHYGFITVLRD